MSWRNKLQFHQTRACQQNNIIKMYGCSCDDTVPTRRLSAGFHHALRCLKLRNSLRLPIFLKLRNTNNNNILLIWILIYLLEILHYIQCSDDDDDDDIISQAMRRRHRAQSLQRPQFPPVSLDKCLNGSFNWAMIVSLETLHFQHLHFLTITFLPHSTKRRGRHTCFTFWRSGLKSRRGDWLSWLRFSWVSLVPQDEFPDSI
jgi:hypothetical protein